MKIDFKETRMDERQIIMVIKEEIISIGRLNSQNRILGMIVDSSGMIDEQMIEMITSKVIINRKKMEIIEGDIEVQILSIIRIIFMKIIIEPMITNRILKILDSIIEIRIKENIITKKGILTDRENIKMVIISGS
jgi:hypothetical protein